MLIACCKQLRARASRHLQIQLCQARAQHSPPIWYKDVRFAAREDQGFNVLLDGKELKTPGRNPLLLPTRALAAAVSAEWQYQDGARIRPHTMPLMALASTAIDEPKPRKDVVTTLVSHLHTDPVCCRHAPGPLAELQAQAYDPALSWAGSALRTSFHVSDSIFGTTQDTSTVSAMEIYLMNLDKWELAAVDSLAGACRSLLLSCAVIKGNMAVPAALTAARLEEDFQLEEWGKVEGGHDLDESDIRVRVAAPAVFARLAALTAYT